MRRIKRTLIAIVIASTLFINASLNREAASTEEADDPDEPPYVLTTSYEVPALSDASKVIAVSVDAREVEREEAREAERQRIKDEEAARIAEVKRLDAIERERLAALEVEREAARERKAKAVAIASKPAEPSRSSDYVGQAQTYEVTHYTAACEGCTGVTASGYDVRNTIYYDGLRVLAAPKHIPLYSIMRVTTSGGSSFDGIVLDRGGDIGNGRLDILVGSKDEARRMGRYNVTVNMIRRGR